VFEFLGVKVLKLCRMLFEEKEQLKHPNTVAFMQNLYRGVNLNDKILSISKRLRSTPFTRRVEAAGVKAYTVYNHMLLPTVFESVEQDYWHLCEAVQVWDVSCQRQVEVRGPDAQRLVQMMTPRNINNAVPGQGLYAP